jgi:hypothetical protein
MMESTRYLHTIQILPNNKPSLISKHFVGIDITHIFLAFLDMTIYENMLYFKIYFMYLLMTFKY